MQIRPRGLKGQNVAVPLRTPSLSDVWIQYSARGKSITLMRDRMRPSLPDHDVDHAHLAHLARAVINQAFVDATPEVDRGGFHKPALSNPRRYTQCQALIWLSSSDPNLLFWCDLAKYNHTELIAAMRPLLRSFYRRFPTVAAKFTMPDWLARESSTAQNRAACA